MPHRFVAKPHAFADGVIFSISVDGEVRQVFVSSSLLRRHLPFSARDQDRVEYVMEHALMLIEAARRKGSSDELQAMIVLDESDL